MRHLRSVLYALVLAPAVWILCGVGLTEDLAGRARDASGGLGILYAVALLVLAGATYATLLLAPISPLGPVLAGLIFLGVSLWSVIAPDAYASVWPSSVTREGFDLSRPGYALGLLLAVPLLCTALNVRRWQRHEPPRPSPVGIPRRGRGTPADAGRTPFASPADITMEIPLSAPPPAPASATRRDLGRAFPTRSNSGPAFAARTDSRPASAARTDSRPASAPRTDSVPAFAEAPTEAVPTEPVPVADSGDAPTIFVVDSAGETTTSTLAVLPADEPTMLTPSDEPTMVTPTPSDEPTMVTPSDEPTVATSSHEPTAAEPDDEPTVAVRTHEPKAEAQASDEPTAVAQPSDEPKAEAQASDEPTAEAKASHEPTAVAQARDEPTAVAQPSDDNTVVLHASTEGIAQPAAGAVRSEDAEPVTTARVPGVEESGAVTEPIAQEPGAAYDEPAPREAGLDDEPAAKQPEPAAGGPATKQPEPAAGEPATKQPQPAAEGPATKPQPADEAPATKQAEAAAEAPAAEPAGEGVAAQPAIDQETDDDLATEQELTPVSAAIAKDPAMWARVTEEDPGERTQVIPLVPVAWEQVTRDLRNAARALGDDDRPAFGPGEQTQVIFRRPPSEAELRQAAAAQAARDRAAQEQSLQAFRDLATQERARQALADRAARAAREQGEDTQVIRLADGRDAADTAEPPGDLTQVLFTPAPDAPAPAPQEPPAGTSSIVGEERPDPADDPTTRLAQAGRQGGSSAAGFGYDNRTTSFLGLERPADEIAGDPTRRLNIPGPREPHDEEEPTRRT